MPSRPPAHLLPAGWQAGCLPRHCSRAHRRPACPPLPVAARMQRTAALGKHMNTGGTFASVALLERTGANPTASRLTFKAQLTTATVECRSTLRLIAVAAAGAVG